MTVHGPFQGVYGENKSINVTTTAASETIKKGTKSVRLVNSGITECYVRVSSTNIDATTNDLLILQGTAIVLGKAEEDIYVSAITVSATTILQVQPGEGGI